MKKLMMITVAGCALSVASACSSGSGTTRGPDEFRIVTKAPLVVPPDYNLRPPQAGQAQPFEVDDTLTGSVAAFGTTIGAGASISERALIASADANAVSPVVRAQVDYEETKTIRKSQGVSDELMFWTGNEDGSPVEDGATGNEAVTIERGSGDRLKLPGT
ncbi:MAG: DUF3035 domain-containing protein [Pseudomonadota bacterium]